MAFMKRVARVKPWLAVYQDPDGKERSKSFPRKADAERFLVAKEGELQRRDVGRPRVDAGRRCRLGGAVPAARTYLPSYDRDESLLRNHIIAHLGSDPLAFVAPRSSSRSGSLTSKARAGASTVVKVRRSSH